MGVERSVNELVGLQGSGQHGPHHSLSKGLCDRFTQANFPLLIMALRWANDRATSLSCFLE